MYEIAENDEFGISIYLTKDDIGVACIIVNADDSEIYAERIVNKKDATRTCNRIYDEYLTGKIIETLTDVIGDEDENLYEIEVREDELDTLTWDFIVGILGGEAYFDGDNFGEIIEDCKEHFIEYLTRKHGLSVYRPMVLEDENGEDFFEEYPYDCMEFDDEDNPIYQ